MKFLADLHIHSPFSRATSKESTVAGLSAWARVKGIHLIGTGDFTHPGWFQQLKEQLIPAEPGLFKLRDEKNAPALPGVAPEDIPVRFILTAEISSIYKRHDRVRKVHNILFAPDLEAAERINRRLAAIGNIESDGRPILGLDSRNLLEIQLEEMEEGFLVPAHIWTPWFSLFGSKSGFDSIEECFGDLTPHIFALETGLSSDPDMNRLVSALDRYTLISNSDCHSPGKLGREVNLFDCELDFFSLKKALQKPSLGFLGTMEFFPEEGKYHLDGHRKCNVVMEPNETRGCRGICPVCGKPLTVGVFHRVMDLADRDTPFYPENGPTFQSLIPLPEVIGEIMGKGPAGKGVMEQYRKTVNRFGSEFNLFLHAPPEEINAFSPLLAEAVARIRTRRVIRRAGFDGEFGVIHAFAEGEIERLRGQAALFADQPPQAGKKPKNAVPNSAPHRDREPALPAAPAAANTKQQQAVSSSARRILVSAGPGTGKTHTLVARLAHLLTVRKIDPGHIAAITFTNRAADEVKDRLLQKAGEGSERVFVGTFHRFCLDWLQRETPDLAVIGDDDRELLVKRLYAGATPGERKKIIQAIRAFPPLPENVPLVTPYLAELKNIKAVDLEMIIAVFVEKLQNDADFAELVRDRVRHLFVDEFQDVNRSQFTLVSLLGRSASLFVIGDANQSIYGFRGSDLTFFLRFAEEPGTECLALDRNYRSAPVILAAASDLIRHNRVRSDVKITAERPTAGRISLFTAPSGRAEAEHVVRQIEKLLGGISSFSINSGRSSGEERRYTFRDIGVLYRLSRQAESLAEALERRGIPFQLVGARPFFMGKDILPLALATLVAAGIATPVDALALCREMPGIGPVALARLEKELPLTGPDFFSSMQSLPLGAGQATILDTLRQATKVFHDTAPASLARAYQPLFSLFRRDPAAANAQRFLRLAGAFNDLASYARHLAENRAATIYDDRAEAVSLLTLHGAKGLEFPVVFITGVNDGLLPCRMPGCDPEEERRLFYVGMTRAKDRLLLSCSGEEKPSPFLAEIPSELVEITKENGPKRNKPQGKQLKLFN
ncbi:MAG: DNA helicase II [Desulfobulbaceae bacterium DB1]|nr:MAG: DNA helicase II [Desulfobulbaceae bacterium DB1]